jgi:hypothetical protein
VALLSSATQPLIVTVDSMLAATAPPYVATFPANVHPSTTAVASPHAYSAAPYTALPRTNSDADTCANPRIIDIPAEDVTYPSSLTGPSTFALSANRVFETRSVEESDVTGPYEVDPTLLNAMVAWERVMEANAAKSAALLCVRVQFVTATSHGAAAEMLHETNTAALLQLLMASPCTVPGPSVKESRMRRGIKKRKRKERKKRKRKRKKKRGDAARDEHRGVATVADGEPLYIAGTICERYSNEEKKRKEKRKRRERKKKEKEKEKEEMLHETCTAALLQLLMASPCTLPGPSVKDIRMRRGIKRKKKEREEK